MINFIRNQRRILRSSNGCQAFRKFNKYAPPYYKSNLALKHRLDGPSLYAVGPTAATNSSRVFQPHNYACVLSAAGNTNPLYSYNAVREFRVGQILRETPSSKVEVTVQNMKNKQKEKVEEIIKEASTASAAPSTPAVDAAQTKVVKAVEEEKKVVVAKKSLKTRIWEELVHYYHGFRLLFVDMSVCSKLLWRVLNGKTLTRRENNLLVRTTSDLFRLIPFSVFIIVPFMELLLPVFIKFFPGMLPSTFQTAKEREDKLKQSLQVRLQMAKFLQKTLDEMAVQHKEHKSEEALQFAEFFRKIKTSGEYVSPEDIIKFSKRFEDEITLDSLSREQLSALCRVLELNTMGTSNFLRFQLRLKLRSLAADDRVIAREGVSSLNLYELQQACKARGMRAYGLTADRLRSQLQEWIDISLNEKVPPTLLLLSRAIFISDDTTTSEKLKETIRVLPDAVGAQTKAAIGEREGKIDNKAKIEAIKEEQRKIKEEREEQREEEKAKAEILLDKAKAQAEVLVDKAPIVGSTTTPAREMLKEAPTLADTIAKEMPATEKPAVVEGITSKDVELLGEALKSLSNDSKKMVVEKETIKELKEELEDYKEDLEELHAVRKVVKEPVKESRAAKLLFKKVNKMIFQLDKVLGDLEIKHSKIHEQQAAPGLTKEEQHALQCKEEDLIYVDDLVQAIRKLKQTSDESRLKHIENVLSKIDTDKDGVITVDEVLKVVEAISRDNVDLNEKQLEEIVILLDKEQLIEAEEKIEKALAKSYKEAQLVEARKQEEQNKIENLADITLEMRDEADDMNVVDQKNNLKTESTSKPEAAILEAVEKQKEKILPKTTITPPTIPTPPPPTATTPSQPMNVNSEFVSAKPESAKAIPSKSNLETVNKRKIKRTIQELKKKKEDKVVKQKVKEELKK